MSKYRYAKFILYGAYMLFAWLIVDVLLLLFYSVSCDMALSSLLASSLLFLLWFLYAYFVYDVARSILDTSMVE